VGVAQHLPAPLGLELLDITRDAFVQALHLVTGIGAAIAIGAAIMVIVFLRHVPARAQHEQALEPDAADAAAIEFSEPEVENAA
jgi:hypothetical protein